MSFQCPYCSKAVHRHCVAQAIAGPTYGGYSPYWGCRREQGHLGPHMACWMSNTETVHLVTIAHTGTHEYLTFQLKI